MINLGFDGPEDAASGGGEATYGLMVMTEGEPPSKVTFRVIRHIDFADYSRYVTATSRTRAAIDGSLRLYAEQAFVQLRGLADQMHDKMRRSSSIPALQAVGPSWLTTVRCAVLTFCASLHLYQEQTYGEAKRAYGEGSSEVAWVKQCFAEAYGLSFSYRLLYRLRNVLIHRSMQCIGLKLQQSLAASAGGLILPQQAVLISLSRREFLAAKKGVSAGLRQELLALDNDPDLLSLCEQGLQALRDVHAKTFELTHPELTEDLRAILDLDELFGDVEGDRSLVELPEGYTAGLLQLPHRRLGQDLFDYAREAVAQA